MWADLSRPVLGAPYCRLLTELLAENGVEPSEVLSGTDIDNAALHGSGGEITLAQEIHLFMNAVRLCDLPGLGLRFGQRDRPWLLGFYGYAILTAANLGDACRAIARYNDLTGPVVAARFFEEGTTAGYLLSEAIPLGPVRLFAIEAMLAGIDTFVRLLSEDDSFATEVHLDYPAPVHRSVYEEVFRCPVVFDCPKVEYIVDPRLLGRPLASANPEIKKASEEHCRVILGRMTVAKPFVEEVKRTMLRIPVQSRNLAAVADGLATSARTVRRRLHEEDTSFQQVFDDVRRELACEYLESTALPVSKIALLLGFSEATNFARAFKHWTGDAPREYRRQAAIPQALRGLLDPAQ